MGAPKPSTRSSRRSSTASSSPRTSSARSCRWSPSPCVTNSSCCPTLDDRLERSDSSRWCSRSRRSRSAPSWSCGAPRTARSPDGRRQSTTRRAPRRRRSRLAKAAHEARSRRDRAALCARARGGARPCSSRPAGEQARRPGAGRLGGTRSRRSSTRRTAGRDREVAELVIRDAASRARGCERRRLRRAARAARGRPERRWAPCVAIRTERGVRSRAGRRTRDPRRPGVGVDAQLRPARLRSATSSRT